MGNPKLFKDSLIAPCGMNCGLCIAFQFAKYDLNKRGCYRRYCPGCRPRAKNCTFMASHCNLMKDGLVRFCYECERFPCERLKRLDKRYSTKYGMSMIENLIILKSMVSILFCQRRRSAGGAKSAAKQLAATPILV